MLTQPIQTLRHRIVTTFFLLSLVLGGCFAAVVYLVVHELETDLFYEHLDHDASWIIQASEAGALTSLPHDMQLFKVIDGKDSELPGYLKSLDKDRSEIVLDNKAYHVIVHRQNGVAYYLVQDQSRFEKMERMIAIGIVLAYIGALAGALWLGSATANRVLSPVTRLARQVESMSKTTDHAAFYPDKYPLDEVGQLARAFERYRLRLKDFLDRERLFTGDVSHELRTPLMVITSSCEVILSRPDQPESDQREIQNIYSASKEMQLLVDVFLMLARNRKSLPDQNGIFSINEIIEEEIDRMTSVLQNRNSVNISVHRTTPMKLQGVPELFRIVFRNLLHNATQSMQQGTVLVDIDPPYVSIEDNGPGVPASVRESVFGQTGNSDSGQGLGLSIVQRICKYHDWNLNLQAVVPAGSRFTINVSSSVPPC